MNFIRNRPWLIVIAAFVGFVAWWVFFISLAVRNQPEEVPLVTHPSSANHARH